MIPFCPWKVGINKWHLISIRSSFWVHIPVSRIIIALHIVMSIKSNNKAFFLSLCELFLMLGVKPNVWACLAMTQTLSHTLPFWWYLTVNSIPIKVLSCLSLESFLSVLIYVVSKCIINFECQYSWWYKSPKPKGTFCFGLPSGILGNKPRIDLSKSNVNKPRATHPIPEKMFLKKKNV